MIKYTIAEALNRLEDGQWHSVAYVSADINKNQGGKIIRIPECKILTHLNQASSALQTTTTHVPAGKAQHHSLNATRNLKLRNGMTRKMHIYTLFAIDKSPVI